MMLLPRILVIESNADQRDLLGVQLRAAGCEPLLCAHMVEGVALARELLNRQQPAPPALALVLDQALDSAVAGTLLPADPSNEPSGVNGWTAGLELRAAMVDGSIHPCPIIGISDYPEIVQPYLEHGGFTHVWGKPLSHPQIDRLKHLALAAASMPLPQLHPAEATPIGRVVRRMVRDLYRYVAMRYATRHAAALPPRTQALVVQFGQDRVLNRDPATRRSPGSAESRPARVVWTREDAEILLAMFTKRARKERFAHGIPHILERVGDYGTARELLGACARQAGLEKIEQDILLLILDGYDIKAIARLIAYSREWVTREIVPRIAERVAAYLNARVEPDE
jgi:hypothetical protein